MCRINVSGGDQRLGVSGGGYMTNSKTIAEEWIGTYVDVDDYVADCGDEDNVLWSLAQAMTDDAIMSGYGSVDVGAIMEALIDRHRAT